MLGLVAIVVSGVSFILNIVGLAIPNWVYASVDYGAVTLKSYGGLWKSCNSVPDKAVVCIELDGTSDSLNAVRAMEILGMLVIIAALSCLILKQFIMKEQQLLPKVGGGCAILAGLLMIEGTVIFATACGLKPEGADLHAGFGLCIVAGILALVAGVLAFVGNKRES